MQTETKTPEIVRLRAYQLWEAEGRPHGRDQAHWYQAESELDAAPRAAAPQVAAPAAKARRRSSANPAPSGRKRKSDEARI